ncbi:MAG: thioredoxin family protein [candidate division Zixibacteria bacterium]|nr:thioredoxin family protein [candidate division Zixibacteria bacterium]
MNNILKLLIILAIVFLIAGLIIFQGRDKASFKEGETSSSEKISTNKDSLDVIAKNLPVLIDLGRGTCKACKMMLPILQELQEEYKGRAIIQIIDIRYDPEPARFYKIRLIPTQIFFDASGKEIYRHEGFMDKLSIEQKLQEIGVK